MGFSWIAGRTIFVLLTVLTACILPSAVRASSIKKVLEAMLEKELVEEVEARGDVNGVEYLKINAVAGSTLEKIVESNALLTARLYEQDLFSLLYDAMVGDWHLWLETMKHKNQNLHYYQHALGSEDETHKSILLIAISRQVKDALSHKVRREFSTWNEDLHEDLLKKKQDEGDECKKRVFPHDSAESVLNKKKLWKSHFVRIKIKEVCILSFAVVAQEKMHNHAFVNKNLFSNVWPKMKFKKDAYEIPISHDKGRLMKMMLKGPDDVEVSEDEHSHVSYQKILLTSSHLGPSYKASIPKLLDEAIKKSWEYILGRESSWKLSTPEDFAVGTFSYYEWNNPPHNPPLNMRIVIAIARGLKPAAAEEILQEDESESTSWFHKTLKLISTKKSNERYQKIHNSIGKQAEKDDCIDLISEELLQRINVYEAYYVHLKGNHCVISYMIVACQDYSIIGPLSDSKPSKILPLSVINKVCPTMKLTDFFQLTSSS